MSPINVRGLDFNENDIPTELSDSLEMHNEGEPAWFHTEEAQSFTDVLLEEGSNEVCSMNEILY